MKKQHQITRRNFLNKCLATAAVPMVANTFNLTKTHAKPKNNGLRSGHRNVLLLISDDHGIDGCGCYGNPVIKTPNIDRLAAEGIRFTNAFTVAASCSPSRSSILTGLYPHQNGQYGLAHRHHHFAMHDWVETLPTLVRQGGYRTGVIGKLHVEPAANFEFDYTVDSSKIMGNRDVFTMAEKAGEFFNQHPDQPFFMLIGYSDPHRLNKTGFGNEREYPGLQPIKYDPSELIIPPFLPDSPEVREELADMYQGISRMDAGIGMVLDKLHASGRYDDTLIIYISDNGIPFPGAKTNLYDSGVRLPMIIRSPGIKGGIVNNGLISVIDLVPTILEFTSAPLPKYALPGRSFLSILNQENPAGWDEIYCSHCFHEVTMPYPMRVIRTKRFKYIHNLMPDLQFPFASDLFGSKTWQGMLQRKSKWLGKRSVSAYLKRPEEELYDLANDPDELINLAGDEKYSSVLEELKSKLNKIREQTNDPWLILEHYQVHREFSNKNFRQ